MTPFITTEEMYRKQSPCCKARLTAYLPDGCTTSIVLCTKCGNQLYKIKDPHTTSPWNKHIRRVAIF